MLIAALRKTSQLVLSTNYQNFSHLITKPLLFYSSNYYNCHRPFTTMNTNSNNTVRSIVHVLESIAPSSMAETWDNVGLLVEPSCKHKSINHIFLTNDLTEPVLEEALEMGQVAGGNEGVGLIVSYHPPMFKPLKRLTQSSAKERIIIKAIENGIGIYSPHTSHDSLWGGVNDWILTAFNKGTITPLSITQSDINTSIELCISKLPNRTTANEIGQYIKTVTSEIDDSCITLCTEEIISGEEVMSLKCRLKKSALNVLVPKFTEEYPLYNLSIGPSLKVPHTGPGRLLEFDNPCPLDTLISQIKTHLKLDHIRIAPGERDDKKEVSSLAVCVGSGASVLRGVKADVYLTGEMSHHDLLEANSKGITVLLCEHSNTERGFLQVFKELIRERLPVTSDIKITLSQVDKDPVNIV